MGVMGNRRALVSTTLPVPALDLTFSSGLFDDRLTFTRASAAWAYNSSGVLTSYATNGPRLDYDPVTLQPRGLLIEEARTNLFLNSAVGVTQSCTVAAAANTLSFFGTGTVTLTGTSTAGPLVGTGAANRVSLTFTPTAGSLTLTVSGSATNVQLELGAFATSPIVTVGSAVTRAADVCSMLLGSWYNAAEGTLLASGSAPAAQSGFPGLASITDGTSSNAVNLFRDVAFTRLRSTVVKAAATQMDTFAASSLDLAVGVPFAAAVGYRANDVSVSFRGAAPVTDALADIPAVTKLEIGTRVGANQWNGHVRAVRYFNRRLENGMLQRLTT